MPRMPLSRSDPPTTPAAAELEAAGLMPDLDYRGVAARLAPRTPPGHLNPLVGKGPAGLGGLTEQLEAGRLGRAVDGDHPLAARAGNVLDGDPVDEGGGAGVRVGPAPDADEERIESWGQYSRGELSDGRKKTRVNLPGKVFICGGNSNVPVAQEGPALGTRAAGVRARSRRQCCRC